MRCNRVIFCFLYVMVYWNPFFPPLGFNTPNFSWLLTTVGNFSPFIFLNSLFLALLSVWTALEKNNPRFLRNAVKEFHRRQSPFRGSHAHALSGDGTTDKRRESELPFILSCELKVKYKSQHKLKTPKLNNKLLFHLEIVVHSYSLCF